MERIHYADDSVLTGNDIAQSLLRYAAALARRGSSATVDIPVRKPDGSVGRASFLLGPASQMISENEESGFDELTDEALVADFEEQISKLGNPQAVAADQPHAGDVDQDLEF